MNLKPPGLLLAGIALVVLTGCSSSTTNTESDSSAEASAFTPVTAGTLTVATVFPAPGVMEGDTPQTLKGGVDWALANQLAKELGMGKVEFVNTNFAALMSGQVTKYDIAVANIITLEKRKSVNDYTDCYYSPVNAALVRDGKKLETLEDAKALKWGLLTGSVNESFMLNSIKPAEDARSYTSPVALTAGLQDGAIDAEYISLQRVSADALTEPLKGKSKIVLLNPENAKSLGLCSAVQLPKGSKNTPFVNTALNKIVDSGAIDTWVGQYVTPLYNGLDLKTLPSITF
ncbi:transporter substrate-binding domain-containing protein [Streptosporangium sp. NPDC004631]